MAAAEGDWIVLTSDRGVNSPREAKLPILCSDHFVTHVILSPGMAKKTMHFKMLSIQTHWTALLALANAPKGPGHSLYLIRGIATGLRPKTLPPTDPPPPPGLLFAT